MNIEFRPDDLASPRKARLTDDLLLKIRMNPLRLSRLVFLYAKGCFP
jgi:hypothetical protein